MYNNTMGVLNTNNIRGFTHTDVLSRDLVINMLRYEDSIGRSEVGQNMYKNLFNEPRVSLNVEKALNRMTLSKFNFDTSEESLANYRTVFRTYYKGPNDYDHEVINSVYYMRNNRCVFYTEPKISVGDKIPDCTVYELDGQTPVTVHSLLKQASHTLFAAFSMT